MGLAMYAKTLSGGALMVMLLSILAMIVTSLTAPCVSGKSDATSISSRPGEPTPCGAVLTASFASR